MYMERFFDMLNIARRSTASDWLTVDDIAKELKVSKSIVYRLIRHGELEAVDIVETNGEIAKKGHYRIKRSWLNQYLERKKVKPFTNITIHRTQSRRVPKVKNHLGL
ncbi:helix-turn-helix domain-containing protein [Planctomycetota bacterium]